MGEHRRARRHQLGQAAAQPLKGEPLFAAEVPAPPRVRAASAGPGALRRRPYASSVHAFSCRIRPSQPSRCQPNRSLTVEVCSAGHQVAQAFPEARVVVGPRPHLLQHKQIRLHREHARGEAATPAALPPRPRTGPRPDRRWFWRRPAARRERGDARRRHHAARARAIDTTSNPLVRRRSRAGSWHPPGTVDPALQRAGAPVERRHVASRQPMGARRPGRKRRLHGTAAAVGRAALPDRSGTPARQSPGRTRHTVPRRARCTTCEVGSDRRLSCGLEVVGSDEVERARSREPIIEESPAVARAVSCPS